MILAADDAGMPGAKALYPDFQRSLQQLFRLIILAERYTENGKVITASRDPGVLGSQRLFIDLERSFIEWLRLPILPSDTIEARQVAQTFGGVRVLRAT